MTFILCERMCGFIWGLILILSDLNNGTFLQICIHVKYLLINTISFLLST